MGHIGDRIVKARKDLDNLHVRSVELDEKIQQGDKKLQEIMEGRVHLRERSTMLQAHVKGLEDEIKREFLDHKPIVIEAVELDYIDRLGDYYQAM